jgi:hypothetical protein
MEVLRPDGSTKCVSTADPTLSCNVDTTGAHTVIVRDDDFADSGGYQLTRTS